MFSWLQVRPDQLPAGSVTDLPKKFMPFLWFFIRQVKLPLLAILIVWSIPNFLLAFNPFFLKLFIDAFQAGSPDQIWDRALLPLSLFLISNLFVVTVMGYFGYILTARTFPPMTNMIRRQLALYTHGHSYKFFQSDFSGRLAGKVIEMPGAINDLVNTVIDHLFYASSIFIAVFIMTVAAAGHMGIVLSVWFCAYAFVLFYFIPRILAQDLSGYEHRSVVRGRFVDTLTNILTVKLFARAKHEDTYLLAALNDTSDLFVKARTTNSYLAMTLDLLNGLMMAAIAFMLVDGFKNGQVTLGVVAMVLPAIINISHTANWVSRELTFLFQKIGEIREGMAVITQSHTLLDAPDAKKLSVSKGDILFDQVTFSYESRNIFTNLNIHIPAGQKVGLVGPSGAGKSTLVQLLLRLFDVQGGAIVIDGQNIAHVQQDSLREAIGVVPQMSDLLHRSIRDNIRYGWLDAPDDVVWDAARKAYADEFIHGLVDGEGRKGLDAHVGERGVKLSGGQRQRIAIARTFLKNAPILVLDEATSALDSESEDLIQKSLFNLMEGKTVIAIAHRLSTISKMDRLLVMQDGKIIEDGRHDELQAKGGAYAKLWAMQSGGFINRKNG